jgi:hypothetical protein
LWVLGCALPALVLSRFVRMAPDDSTARTV